MIDHLEKMPEGSVFTSGANKDNVYRGFLQPVLTSYVNIENGISNYDSPEFLKALTFINSFPAPKGYKTELDYAVPNFVYRTRINNFKNYHNLFYDGDFKTGDIRSIDCTFTGYPSDDGCGAYIDPMMRFSVSAKSTPEKQKGAWLFIKELLSYDFQYNMSSFNFPVNLEAFSESEKMNIHQLQITMIP